MRVPTNARWQAGQHFFVRFFTLGIHAWSIHPFTACSLPRRMGDRDSTKSELVFYIRPRGGFTARLARLAESKPQNSVRVLLDGPYGGVDMRKIEQSQHLLVIAGGSGAGWLLPMISAFIERQRLDLDENVRASGRMRVVLATRDVATSEWFKEAVRNMLDGATLPQIELFYTGSNEDAAAQKSQGQFLQKLAHPKEVPDAKQSAIVSDDAESNTPSSSSTAMEVKHFQRRPDLPAAIREEVAMMLAGEQLGVFLCGPPSMQSDVQNAVAAEQLRVVKGAQRSIYLHMEHFSWA